MQNPYLVSDSSFELSNDNTDEARDPLKGLPSKWQGKPDGFLKKSVQSMWKQSRASGATEFSAVSFMLGLDVMIRTKQKSIDYRTRTEAHRRVACEVTGNMKLSQKELRTRVDARMKLLKNEQAYNDEQRAAVQETCTECIPVAVAVLADQVDDLSAICDKMEDLIILDDKMKDLVIAQDLYEEKLKAADKRTEKVLSALETMMELFGKVQIHEGFDEAKFTKVRFSDTPDKPQQKHLTLCQTLQGLRDDLKDSRNIVEVDNEND